MMMWLVYSPCSTHMTSKLAYMKTHGCGQNSFCVEKQMYSVTSVFWSTEVLSQVQKCFILQ